MCIGQSSVSGLMSLLTKWMNIRLNYFKAKKSGLKHVRNYSCALIMRLCLLMTMWLFAGRNVAKFVNEIDVQGLTPMPCSSNCDGLELLFIILFFHVFLPFAHNVFLCCVFYTLNGKCTRVNGAYAYAKKNARRHMRYNYATCRKRV